VTQQLDAPVSAREAEVLAALGEHLTNAEIAERLTISVRTVESHVSSLLRKVGAADRRELIAAAARGADPTDRVALPVPLTTFVGRDAERAELAGLLGTHRLVTAVGPGGVGKTRLAIRVAGELADRWPDGVRFADLAPVTAPDLVVPTLADALGLGEHQARTAVETVHGWLGRRRVLLVLDNCEHLLDGLAAILERLLLACPGVTVLATSRARLLVPFEQVFTVEGLPPDAAVTLFAARAAAAGAVLTGADLPRVAEVCAGLEGTALAIELAAARLPALGLDGLRDGLADRLRLLAGGGRLADRHRSLRSTLDWSHDLLDPPARAVLRRVSVFAGPFSAATAAAVLGGWPPDADEGMAAVLAQLVDHSLLVPVAGPAGTRYRALETVRQYGAERLAGAGEAAAARARHLDWCLREAAALEAVADKDDARWRYALDEAAVELRAALAPAADTERAKTERLAWLLAGLAFDRGTPGEAQRLYELSAALTADADRRIAALECAAGAAEVRHLGNEALRLRDAAADAALAAGQPARAAMQLARAAELIHRAPGLMPELIGPAEVAALVDRARTLAGTDPAPLARLLLAEAFRDNATTPRAAEWAADARATADRVGEPLLRSAALDALASIRLTEGDVQAAAAYTLERLDILAPLRMTAAAGLEFADAYNMATDCALAAGDLRRAREFALRVRRLPFQREEEHLATTRLILVTMLAGAWDDAMALAQPFLDGYERAGRPVAGALTRGALAIAAIHGFRGDAAGEARWRELAATLTVPDGPKLSSAGVLHGMLLLHRGEFAEAVHRLLVEPSFVCGWHDGMWQPWHAALSAEAAVLAGLPDAGQYVTRAAARTAGNPVAVGLARRAAALLARDEAGLTAAAEHLRASGCHYEWARTLALHPDPAARERGEAAIAALGATPPVRP
jgi:predicted ATPase/DNA-binding CsgD family transcriptional regulator